jgi:hypothetical protein
MTLGSDNLRLFQLNISEHFSTFLLHVTCHMYNILYHIIILLFEYEIMNT